MSTIDSGRAPHHNLGSKNRQNFVKRDTFIGGYGDGYIEDPNAYRSKWQERRDLENEKKRAERIAICKKILFVFVVLAVLAFVILVIINKFVCFPVTVFWEACPKGCNTCQLELNDWRVIRNADNEVYIADKEHCEEALYVTLTDNAMKVSETKIDGSKSFVPKSKITMTAYTGDLSKAEKDRNYFGLSWNIEKTQRNNESIMIEFSDNGTEHTGLGRFTEAIIKDTENTDYKYNLWTTKDNPAYLPYYLTFSEQGAVCIFLYTKDSVPAHVQVSDKSSTWKIYSKSFEFHFFNALTAASALQGCSKKWAELYTFSKTTWSDKIIFGGTNTADIKKAQDTPNILATHYMLSGDNVEIADDAIKIKDSATLNSLSNVFLAWDARATINTEKVKALYNDGILEAEDKKFYMDYTEPTVKSWLTTVVKSQSSNIAGFILTDGYLPGALVNDKEGNTEKVKPIRAAVSYPRETGRVCCDAKEAIDESLYGEIITAKAKPQDGGNVAKTDTEVFIRIELGKMYTVEKITIYAQYFTDWPDATNACADDVNNYLSCIEKRTDVKIEVYKGKMLQGSCGTLTLNKGLEKADQVYKFECALVGDIVKLSKDADFIAVGEVSIEGKEEFYCETEYLYCDKLDYDKRDTPCTGIEFGQNSTMFQQHNIYEKTRTEFLKEVAPDLVTLQSAVSPGITNYFRKDSEASWKGLGQCFREMVNLQMAGVYGYSCNLCGGAIIKEGMLCERWSELTFLMPHVVMVNDTVFPVMADGSEPGRYVKNKLDVRSKYHYYLEDEFYKAQEENKPFIYPLSLIVPEKYEDETMLMIGESIFFAPVLDTSLTDLKVQFPSGSQWLQVSSGTVFSAGQTTTLQGTTALDNLLFYQIHSNGKNAFILQDTDDANGVEVHIIPMEERNYEMEMTLDIHKDGEKAKLTVSIPGTTDKIKFVAEGGDNFGLKISKILVYQWFTENMSVPNWITYSAKPGGKYDVEFNFKMGNKDYTLMTSQSIAFVDGDSSTG